MGEKPSPTSGRVSIEMQRGGALSKLKLRKVCATGRTRKYDKKKSTDVRCESDTSRSWYRAVKSSLLRYSKSRTPVIRTRSPSIVARGITATSGRHGRWCEGRMEIHQTSTHRNTPAKTRYADSLRARHKAQIPNAKKANASANRSQAHGRLE